MTFEAWGILGVDLRLIEGIGLGIILTIISELGRNVPEHFTSAGKLSSYLGLSPGCSISGGKVLRKNTKKVSHRLSNTLRMAALSLRNSNSWLGAFFRIMRARQGTPKAITSTAHKFVRLIYGLLKSGEEYIMRTAAEEEATHYVPCKLDMALGLSGPAQHSR